MKLTYLIILSLFSYSISCFSQHTNHKILPGAYQTRSYFPLLKDKRIAVFANHTSFINHTHLIDTLINSGIKVVKIFAPEHGFRGVANAGETVSNTLDSATGLPIISLYGNHTQPTANELKDIDIILFDIQDVGVRFYTYISSLEELMQAAIENNKPLIVLDRPNPNGFYVDGPVLDSTMKSFVGKQCIPIVYGMTIGEYAKMLIGENLLPYYYTRKTDNHIHLGQFLGFEEKKSDFYLTVINCKNYLHSSKYSLPIPPSPNLPNMTSVYWYPSNCLFEGTIVAEGRGTDQPFCIIGHPSFPDTLYSFMPVPNKGANNPKYAYSKCYGWNLTKLPMPNSRLTLKYLIESYQIIKDKNHFFEHTNNNYFFNKLAGNTILMHQIQEGMKEEEIRKTWQKDIEAFKKMRKKYLLYPDFE